MSSNPKSVDLWQDTSWFAIHTKARREKFAAANISALGIEVLLPFVKVERLGRAARRAASNPCSPDTFLPGFALSSHANWLNARAAFCVWWVAENFRSRSMTRLSRKFVTALKRTV